MSSDRPKAKPRIVGELDPCCEHKDATIEQLRAALDALIDGLDLTIVEPTPNTPVPGIRSGSLCPTHSFHPGKGPLAEWIERGLRGTDEQ